MIAADPLATVPLTKARGPTPATSAFIALAKDPASPSQYLVEITAYRGGEIRSGGLATLTEIPLASIAPGDPNVTDIGEVTLNYADIHWCGAPDDDDKPNTFYEGRVVDPISIVRNAPILPEEVRRVQRQFGEIEIANADGDLDAILSAYAVDGRRVRVLWGPRGNAYSDFGTVADVIGTGWSSDATVVRLGLRDQSFSLDLPLQSTLYAGSGGAEGGGDLTGKPKPLCFGRCRNITPVLIDATNLIYQVHDGIISAVDDVFDRGAALTDSSTDVASYAALVSQSVTSGQFATSFAVGMLKLGALPDGLITADIRGDADPSYSNTLDVISLRILKDRAGLADKLIDSGSFAGAAAIAGELGIFLSQNELPTTAEVISSLMASVGGWWGAGRDGRIRAGRMVAPEDRSPALYLDTFNVMSFDIEPPTISRWRQRIAYKKNWTIQRGEDLASSVTAARRQFLTESDRWVSDADATVKNRHLQALDPIPLQSLYEISADADTLATYLLGLHSPDRRIFRIVLRRLGYLLDLGSIVQITWPRHGLSGGQNFIVVGLTETAVRDEIELRVFG